MSYLHYMYSELEIIETAEKMLRKRGVVFGSVTYEDEEERVVDVWDANGKLLMAFLASDNGGRLKFSRIELEDEDDFDHVWDGKKWVECKRASCMPAVNAGADCKGGGGGSDGDENRIPGCQTTCFKSRAT